MGSRLQHCNQSRVCDHEYDHMVTDVEREPDHEDIVLVSPQYGLCPECTRAGYDQRPGGNNPPPKTPSRMPMDFEYLPREDFSRFESASKIPNLCVCPAPVSKVSQSYLPSNAYNPGASRVPPSNRQVHGGQAGPQESSQSTVRHAANSRSQRVALHERDPHRASQSQLSAASQQPSHSEMASVSRQTSHRPPTSSSSTVHHDGSGPRLASGASHIYVPTKAPTADEEGPDLEVLLNTPTVIPSSRYSEPLSPPGGTKFRAVLPPSSRISAASRQPHEPSPAKRSEVSSLARSEVSRRDIPVSSQSKAAASSVRETPSYSQMRLTSKAPALSSRARPRATSQHDLPSYKTKASIPSASRIEISYKLEYATKQTQPASKHSTVVMSPAELLKRGPPKNVNASAFYDNLDGDEAKAQVEGRGQAIRPSASCMPRINVPRDEVSKR